MAERADKGRLGAGRDSRARSEQISLPASPALSLLTLVLGSMRLTPYLLMAIKRISGKFGSVVC